MWPLPRHTHVSPDVSWLAAGTEAGPAQAGSPSSARPVWRFAPQFPRPAGPAPRTGPGTQAEPFPAPCPFHPVGQYLRASPQQGQLSPDPPLPPFPRPPCSLCVGTMSPQITATVTGLPGPHFVLSQLSSKATPSPAMGVPCSPLFMEVAPGFGNVSEPVAVTATGAGSCGIS